MTGPAVHEHRFVFAETAPLPEAPAWMLLSGYEQTLRDFWAGRITADGQAVGFSTAPEGAVDAVTEFAEQAQEAAPAEHTTGAGLRSQLLGQIFAEHVKHGSDPTDVIDQDAFRNL